VQGNLYSIRKTLSVTTAQTREGKIPPFLLFLLIPLLFSLSPLLMPPERRSQWYGLKPDFIIPLRTVPGLIFALQPYR